MVSDPPLRHTPLEAVHERLGARFTAFAGWRLPVRYGSELAEHHAVRRAAGVFDLSHMAELVVEGAAAATVVDATLVGSFAELAIGRARYSLCCEEGGGVVDDVVVYRTATDRFLVVANAGNRQPVAEALEAAAVGRPAAVVDRTDELALVAVQGPRAAEVVRRLATPAGAARVGGLAGYGCAEVELAGVPALVGRTGYTGEDGFECFVAAPAGAALFEAVLAAGRDDGVVPAGLAARDSLRLEAGMALYGNELSRDVHPDEAGLGRLVRLDKPAAFPGRPALDRRLADPAGPRRRLVGLVGNGRRAGRHGYAVVAADRPDQPVGRVTSGALSPTLGRPIAMAYVDAGQAAHGTQLEIDVRGDRSEVEVAPLPFYRRRGADGA